MTDETVVPFRPHVVGEGYKVGVDKVLAGACLANLTTAVVVGVTPSGDLYVASSGGEMEAVFYLQAAITSFFVTE